MFKGATATGKFLVRLIPALALIACGDDPQVPTSLAPASTAIIDGVVGSALANVPSVTLKDQKGKGMANVWVKWTPSAGKVVNDSSLTDGNGTASSGVWTLGTTAGAQTLKVSAGGLPVVTIYAQVKPGPTAALLALGTASTGVVGGDVAVLPSVRAVDAFNNAVPDAPVQFAVSGGAGTITGAQQITNANGIATVGSWKLGTAAGTQSLRADVVATGASVILNATAVSGAPAQLVLVEGSQQVGQPNKRVCTTPLIAVRDAFGNGVGGVNIVFTPQSGSGTVANASVLTSASTGFAAAGWNLAASGEQTLVATAPALPGKSVTFTATVASEPKFSICARFVGQSGTPRQREAVARAVAKWQTVIVGHIESDVLTGNADGCLPGIGQLTSEPIDDLLLYVKFSPIDGPSKIIGQAAPCAIYGKSRLTALGFLELDAADLDLMEQQGLLDNVVTHEIGHILGIGTLWNFGGRSFLSGGFPGLDPLFSGAAAREQFATLFSTYVGNPIPVENCVGITGCGAGTRDAHWRKSVFGTELMQGYVAPTMKMSGVTVASLADLGYTVDIKAADALTALSSLRASSGSNEVQLTSDVADVPLWVIDNGGAMRMVRASRNPLKRQF